MDVARWLCPKAVTIHNNSTLNIRALYLPPTRYHMLFLLLASIHLRRLWGLLLIVYGFYPVDEYAALLFTDQLNIFLSNLFASLNHFFLLSSVCASGEFVNFLWTLKALNFYCYLTWNDFINSIFCHRFDFAAVNLFYHQHCIFYFEMFNSQQIPFGNSIKAEVQIDFSLINDRFN